MIHIREFAARDYDEVIHLWHATEGIVLRTVDERPFVEQYLRQNPGLSFVACDEDRRIVGAVLCGTDGRRGYLQHLAVVPAHRGHGIGRTLAERAVAALAEQHIEKCHIMVVQGNTAARAFWARLGWIERSDISVMSHTVSRDAKAE